MNNDMTKMINDFEEIAQSLKNGNFALNDIPISAVHTLVKDVFNANGKNEEFIQSVYSIYGLACQYGNAEQQAAFFELLKNLLRILSEKNDEIEQWKSVHEKYRDIVTAYAEDRLTEQYIDAHTWGDVSVLKDDTDKETFWKISEEIRKKNIERIKKQDKIKVAFITKDSSEWSADALYQMLLKDERYEVYVMVAPFLVGTNITIIDTYTKTLEYFENKGYQVYGMADIRNDVVVTLEWELLPVPDVIFMLNPHVTAFAGSSNVEEFPLRTLITYIPYGFPIFGDTIDQYNQISHALCWKIFWEDEIDVEISRKHSDMGDRNAEMSGYLKMDGFYLPQANETAQVWKIPEGKNAEQIKKIVYAPHWSIREACTGFGNFDKLYDKMYEYAKSHTDTTSWIFRPHPMLRAGVVWYGVFKTEKEFDDYMKKWDELPNARVVERGEYIDIFKTSDALIGDSISFLAEYQYTHKPLLFLTRDTNTWDEFGEKLLKILYTAAGDDFDAVEKFIEDVVINKKDTMYQERMDFFDKYLNYKKINGKLACEYIKEILDETLN
jgi:hypothetical protein